MSETTNLKLFKHDNPETNENQFDVEKALNENWDKIDGEAGKVDTKLSKLEIENIELKSENERLKEDLKGLPTGTFSGESIDLNDSAEMRLQSLGICGNSRQEEITENLINNDWDQGGINDITGIEQTDTTKIRSDFIEVHSNNLYSIKRDVFNLYMAYRFYDKDKKYLGNQLTEAMLSSDKEDNRMNTNESSMTFTILNNNVRYMRIIDASNNLNTKYILTTEARNPNYPSEVECCGDNINIFNKDNVNYISAYLASNKTITSTNYVKTYYIECKSNKTYTISKKIGKYFRVATSSKIPEISDTVLQIAVADENTSITITTDSNAKYLLFNCRNSQADTLTEQEILESIKIEEGPKVTPYSKYGQGNINFEMCNKNFLEFTMTGNIGVKTLNSDGSLTCKTGNSEAVSITFLELAGKIPEGKYTFTNLQGLTAYVMFNASDYTHSVAVNNKYTFNYDGQSYLRIIYANQPANRTITYKAQLEKGTQTTDYEPHKSQTYTIPTQKPFRKIDTYKDTFIRKDRKWYERHFVERYIFKGTEGFTMMSDSNETFSRFTIRKYDMKNSSVFMCSHFKVIKQSELTAEESISIRDISKDNVISIMILKSRLSNVSAEGFKNWLSNQYNAGTPIYVDYVLAEPQDIECTAEQCEILDKINNEAKTYKKITHMYSTNSVAPILEGIYNKDIETYVKNEINNAIA